MTLGTFLPHPPASSLTGLLSVVQTHQALLLWSLLPGTPSLLLSSSGSFAFFRPQLQCGLYMGVYLTSTLKKFLCSPFSLSYPLCLFQLTSQNVQLLFLVVYMIRVLVVFASFCSVRAGTSSVSFLTLLLSAPNTHLRRPSRESCWNTEQFSGGRQRK